ncbi:hypothetical protein FNV43_RR16328 [Rhamnella rubrinervis]|uniref:Uncharacterized protein n=1 Tax=Rhamnella rubrinervis TaxID=2594499 RepID=A0A8K0GYK0_9ROSA|nr:hypothetical protein FNV43_RR16328 [Rhamnella rubrinervis]
MAISHSSSPLFHLLFLTLFFIAIQARVPENQTFIFVNHGEFGQPATEYQSTYRVIQGKNVNFYTHPFQLCFYNTTPGAYILAMRAGIPGDGGLMRWVWDANRNHPVGENATLSFGSTGNLALSEANGAIVWQTNTANKGVTGIKLLSNGNLVLHDKVGKFIWQSFYYPTDTLVVGQSLRVSGRNKLVSRKSDKDGSDGIYSYILGHTDLYLYMYLNNLDQQIKYSGFDYSKPVATAVFDGKPADNGNSTAYQLTLTIYEPPSIGYYYHLISRTLNYNTTLSYIKLGSDGNLKAYTYHNDNHGKKSRWEESFAYFSSYYVRECSLPTKCGSYGLCDKGVCLACPTTTGLVSWNESCAPTNLAQCKSGAAANYYKIDGARHFLDSIRDGGDGLDLEECRKKCDEDCNCLGFFHREESGRCLIAPVLGTLSKDNKVVAYIKYYSN